MQNRIKVFRSIGDFDNTGGWITAPTAQRFTLQVQTMVVGPPMATPTYVNSVTRQPSQAMTLGVAEASSILSPNP